MSRSSVWTFLSVVVVLIALVYIIDLLRKPNVRVIQKEYITITDTIQIRDTVRFTTKPKIIIRKDTVFCDVIKPILTKPDTIFEACIDTNLNGWQLTACYQFPINQFLFSGTFKKDTIRAIETIRLVEQNRIWYDYWYEYLGVFVVGALIGLAIR